MVVAEVPGELLAGPGGLPDPRGELGRPGDIELGVIAHGPDSSKLAGRTSELLHRWSQKRPTQPIITAYPAGTPSDKLSSGTHIGRPDTSFTVGW